MPEVILQTKLNIPPLRPSLVERTHLINKLNEGLLAESGANQSQLFNRKLTLISAPAGFGKTTLGRPLPCLIERVIFFHIAEHYRKSF